MEFSVLSPWTGYMTGTLNRRDGTGIILKQKNAKKDLEI